MHVPALAFKKCSHRQAPTCSRARCVVIKFSRMRSTWQAVRAPRPGSANGCDDSERGAQLHVSAQPRPPPRMMCMSAGHEGLSWRKDCPEIHRSERLWMQVRGLEISSDQGSSNMTISASWSYLAGSCMFVIYYSC